MITSLRVYFVGGNAGLGLHTSKALVEAGYRVVIGTSLYIILAFSILSVIECS